MNLSYDRPQHVEVIVVMRQETNHVTNVWDLWSKYRRLSGINIFAIFISEEEDDADRAWDGDED